MHNDRLVRFVIGSALFVSGLVMQTVAVFAQNICIPDVGGLTGSPNITDGRVEGDLGWNGAAQVNLDENRREQPMCPTPPCPFVVTSSAPRDAAFYVGKTATDVYLGVRINRPVLAAGTTVVLTLSKDDATTGASDDWKIQIGVQNTNTNPASGPVVPHVRAVTYWRDSTTWNSAGGLGSPAVVGDWLIDNVYFSDQGSAGWQLEMKIPRASNAASAGPGMTQGVFFPPSSPFRMYVNVLSTSAIAGAYNQDPWPAGVIILPSTTSNDLPRLTPDKPVWGVASLQPRRQCVGVSLAWNQIGVEDAGRMIGQTIRALPPPAGGYPGGDHDSNGTVDIRDCQALPDNYNWPGMQGTLNSFIARPTSTAEANGVFATFYVASWGIPGVGDWKKIGDLYPTMSPPGVSDHPTLAGSITSGGTVDLRSRWGMSFKQSCVYALSNSGHHCIQVDLDSTDLNTVFLNRSVQRNMEFVTASVFQRDATISAKGLGAPPPGQANHRYLLTVDTARQQYVRDGKYYYPRVAKDGGNVVVKDAIPEHVYEKGLSEALIWVADGFVDTGKKLRINNNLYSYAKRTGSFGYVVGHAGEIVSWNQALTGQGLTQLGNGVYSLSIPEDGVVKVSTHVEAKETGPRGPCECWNILCHFKGWVGW